LNSLSNSKYFGKNHGRDHVLIEDDSPYFSWKHDVAAWRRLHDMCKECVTVTPDTTLALRHQYRNILSVDRVVATPHPSAYHHHPTLEGDHPTTHVVEGKRTRKRKGKTLILSNETYHHPWDPDTPPPVGVRVSSVPKSMSYSKRLVTTVGTVHKADKTATKIRSILDKQIKKCYKAQMPHRGQGAPDCLSVNLKKNTYKRFKSTSVEAYRASYFCLCAPGDLEIRRALFDIILSGCIPVTFVNSTLSEYRAYYGDSQVAQVGLHLPSDMFLKLNEQVQEREGKGLSTTVSSMSSSSAGVTGMVFDSKSKSIIYDPVAVYDTQAYIINLLKSNKKKGHITSQYRNEIGLGKILIDTDWGKALQASKGNVVLLLRTILNEGTLVGEWIRRIKSIAHRVQYTRVPEQFLLSFPVPQEDEEWDGAGLGKCSLCSIPRARWEPQEDDATNVLLQQIAMKINIR
jgi:hypothetical protein